MSSEATLYGLRTSLKGLLEHLIPNSKISFYGEFVKIQSEEDDIKSKLKTIEGLYFKK